MAMTMITATETEKGFIKFGNWESFKEQLNSVQNVESPEQLCEATGIEIDYYNRIINSSAYSWIDSPSKSLFHGLGLTGLRIPEEGEAVFNSLLSQTRFLMRMSELRMLTTFNFQKIEDENGEKIKVNGSDALTYRSSANGGLDKLNKVLQVIYLYFYYCKHKEIAKMPKKIYRGIRISDLRNLPVMKDVLESLDVEKGADFRKRNKAVIDAIIDVINKEGLNAFYDLNLLSFTASKSVAKYFANKNGIIIEVNTKDVEIMTSELHDERFAEKDYYSNRCEREYIVRLPKEKLSVSNVIISDLDYMIETNNPLAVALFDHSDKSATYMLNGVNIKAYFVWTSNTTSAIRYKNMDEDSWSFGVKDFKDNFGFSPVISAKNIKDVKDFKIKFTR